MQKVKSIKKLIITTTKKILISAEKIHQKQSQKPNDKLKNICNTYQRQLVSLKQSSYKKQNNEQKI